ncbi:putative multicopper oxidases [Methylocaldum marinum]|uniref:Putative multicopper oxidases n=1 Tax=Methylocaldum marinum TaxID=1432792 RepID=A0A250KS35_9GAMM|nr:multicopper oxidase domain-containing protein [Methylocaldum marinum]BBA34458.1 putative multicopper oxidases [Methylocaldum marinum]
MTKKIKTIRRHLDVMGDAVFHTGATATITLAALAPLAFWSASPARAAVEERVVEDPPRLELREGTQSRMTLMPRPTPGPRVGMERELDLNIVYTDSQLYNPATGKYDKVRLRSYVGTDTNPNRPFVAPTIEVTPGDTVRITLNNKLPADPSCPPPDGDVNTPHCFNSTNLHGHGLWVSPTGNSDNVLLTINPGVSFQYEYNLPPDHPAGTYWYHSHLHGSTALQVSSGMAGALIVRGDRLPSDTANGDIDTLLKNPNGQPLRERVLVLQQIQYACLDEYGNVLKDSYGQVVWNCPNSKTGIHGIESYDQFGPGSWPLSGRYTSINGAVLPTFKARAGEIERWRMIHAGVRDTISLQFRRLKSGSSHVNRLTTADADRFIANNCVGDPIPFHVIAEDGLTRAAAWQTPVTVLQPGYRSDALVVFPEAGPYCVIDTSAPAAGSISGAAESRQLLGVVVAGAGRKVQDVHDYLTQALVTAARRTMPVSVRSQIVADLEDGLKLTRFTPHPDIADSEVTGTQELGFFIDVSNAPDFKFLVSNDLGPNPDFQAYDPSNFDRTLTLGGVDEWTMQSHFVSHPFHIHINPFQIVKILDPSGRDISAPGEIDNAGGCIDPQYPGLKGVWKDTLWLKSLIGFDTCNSNPGTGIYTLVVRTRYQRYIGDFVLHCHILDHEDQGMMQNVRIGIPDGQGGTAAAAHH